jgi:uncharacterized protein YndB with AHSA1/START domain
MAAVGHSESVQLWIGAPPAVVYELVSDPTRMPQWSPEVVRVAMEGGSGRAQAGMRFRGTSRARLRWTRTCEVLAADPPSRFVFRTLPTRLYSDSTIWTFEIRPDAGGSCVTQRYEVAQGLNTLLRWAVRLNGRPRRLAPHLERTLIGLKATAEHVHGSSARSEPRRQ